ncbi:head scaffolding protein [Edwardsiella phage PEi20]|uniref:Prohead core protein n=2 Tax=Kanagawavirus pei20 TaxID=2844109 RepID=A0A0B6VPF9_9CAUD|nr:head scaffolding protein [Edwardsiella phage PEi20]BAQ22840.1 prohead core protein [Edwardsiella phage PEi20]BAQ23143.1 prohead core protein [Edwardsiella phage PEi26]
MFLIPDEYELVTENVDKLIPEAQGRFAELSAALDKADINNLVENMIAGGDIEMGIALGSLNEEMQLDEFIVKHVSSRGELTRTKDRKTRERNAFQTTGLSKAKRRQIARKASKTKRANPSIQVRGERKRKKARAKRKAFGLS